MSKQYHKRFYKKLGNAELAVAMELRAAGMHWEAIAEGLGVERCHIAKAVACAEDLGMHPARPEPRSIIRSAVVNRIAQQKIERGVVNAR